MEPGDSNTRPQADRSSQGAAPRRQVLESPAWQQREHAIAPDNAPDPTEGFVVDAFRSGDPELNRGPHVAGVLQGSLCETSHHQSTAFIGHDYRDERP